ncbi:sugar ABC transporter substrate-binding protein [Candidatus Aerophobetes bacterium]|nr:sugar ABC transporter substrate-binding protein [Candidatus Aerophobetes bacterium]
MKKECKKRIVLFLVALLVGALGAMAAASAEEFNWQRFAGTRIRLVADKHPAADAVYPHIPEFEKLTGIKVEYEILPEIQARQKKVVELASRSATLDAFVIAWHVEKKGFYDAGWITPLNNYLKDPTLTAPDYDWEDFTPAVRDISTQPDDSVTFLMQQIDPWILYYRKDIFRQRGIAIPQTLDEMEEIARKLNDPANDFYSVVYRGLKYANTPVWCILLFKYGGDFFDKEGEPAINSPAGIKAADWYARMLRNYGAPGVVNFNWYECSSTFMAERAAMYFDGIGFAGQFEDPEKSKVVGKTGYTLFPAGPGGRYAGTFGGGYSVSRYSANKEAAYLFITWATNKENTLRVALSGVGTGRVSVLQNPDYIRESPMPSDWRETFIESLKIARLGLPEIAAVGEFRDIVGIALVNAIEGGDVKALMDEANKKFKQLLLRTEPERYR